MTKDGGRGGRLSKATCSAEGEVGDKTSMTSFQIFSEFGRLDACGAAMVTSVKVRKRPKPSVRLATMSLNLLELISTSRIFDFEQSCHER